MPDDVLGFVRHLKSLETDDQRQISGDVDKWLSRL
jgi:hypothetical protein